MDVDEPGPEWAADLANTLLRDLPDRWRHTRAVAAAAERAAATIEPSRAADLIAAAWLHDIGYAELLAVTGFHPVDGATYLREHDAPQLVVSLVAHHSCAEFEARERGLAGELALFPAPPADVLDALVFADMTTGPTGDTVTVEQRLAEILRRYPPTDPVHRAITAATPALRAAVHRVDIAWPDPPDGSPDVRSR